MSSFNTSFLTLTLAAFFDVFNQCCFASCANSDSPSATGPDDIAGVWVFGGCDEALFFCLFAVGMVTGDVLGMREVIVASYPDALPKFTGIRAALLTSGRR